MSMAMREHGIGHHQGIGAARLGRACQHGGDVADVGRELRPHRRDAVAPFMARITCSVGFRIHGKGVAVFLEVGLGRKCSPRWP